MVLALSLGLLAAWVRKILQQQELASQSSYASAYRLLSQLRVVSRQLSGGLDPVSLSQGLLQGLRQGVFFSRAAVYVRSEGGRLVPMAYAGVDRADWTPALDDDSGVGRGVELRRRPEAPGDLHGGDGGYSAVMPLRVGVRTIGLVGMERTEAPFTEEQLAQATELVAEASLRLETALLFSEVRSIATAEERRRLAREIHDGIAQELASLGYAVDDLSYRATDEQQREQLQELRARADPHHQRAAPVDLRPPQRGAADHGPGRGPVRLRPTGRGDVSPHGPPRARRVPQPAAVDTEAELLRIAQEAITNVRKHARAPESLGHVPDRTSRRPAACRGRRTRACGAGRSDSYGLEIMRERASRIGAELTVGPRAERWHRRRCRHRWRS